MIYERMRVGRGRHERGGGRGITVVVSGSECFVCESAVAAEDTCLRVWV
jgi:hypothetical protein